jgi:hypothetical protein
MATYTNLGIKQITTGDESGTWGDSTNTNFDYFDTAIVGYVSVTLASAGSSGSPNTLNVADFAASNGRNRIVEFVDAGDLGGTVYVQVTPNDFEGYYFIRNGLSGSRSILLFQGTYDAARDYEIPNGKNIVVRCSGSGGTSYIYNILENLQVGNLSVSSLTASTALALDANKNVASVTNTGTGNNVLATSPTLVTPVLGTPTSGTLTNCTGLPVSTGISGLGANVGTFLATPTSANLAAAVTNETGSGALVFATAPSLTGQVSVSIPASNNAGINVNSDTGNVGTIRKAFQDSVTVPSAAASQTSFLSSPSTADAVFTLPAFYGFKADGIFKIVDTTAGATITNQYAVFVDSANTSGTTNYGFYSAIAASGTSRYNFYAAGTAPNYFGGNTIVSVTDNTNAALRVTQTGTANALEVEDSTNPDSTPFIVNNAGQLIQGYTTTVESKVVASAVTPVMQIQGANVGNSSVGVYNWANGALFSGSLIFNKSKSGTIGTLSAVTDGDNLGIIQFNGADSGGSPTFNPGALISAQVAGTVASTSIPSRLNFSVTAAGDTSSTLRMSLSPEGYLALGSNFTTPQQMLDIRANNTGLTGDAPLNVIRFTDQDTATAANQPLGKIEFYNSDTTNSAVGAYILSSSAGVDGGGTIRFGAAANAAAVAEICRVADTGFTMTKDTAGLGYGTGTGGAVTQLTNRTTGVTLNKTNGAITLVSAAGSATWQSFTVTNSTVAATDTVIVNQKSGTDLYMIHVTAVAAGSFRISFATTGGTTTEQPVFNFAVIKAVAA